jgi:hypothetical protein
MSQAMFYTKDMFRKSSKRQRAMTIDPPLVTDNNLSIPKQRSSSFSNAIHQVVGFLQRKLSRSDVEDKQQFINLQEKHF